MDFNEVLREGGRKLIELEEIEAENNELSRKMNEWIELQDTTKQRNIRSILKGETDATVEEIYLLFHELNNAREAIASELHLGNR